MKKQDKLTIAAVACASAAAGAVLMLLLTVLRFGGFAAWPYVSKLAAALRVVADDYVGDWDYETLADGAMDGVAAALNDRWSYYMTAEEYQNYLDYTANRYQGIGVTITKDEATGGFRIVSLSADGPAERAGVAVGEIILACDGTDVTAGDTAELRALIQADYGGEARLTLLAEDGTTRELAVSCGEIKTVAVTWELLDGGVGYVYLKNFEEGVAAEAVAAVDELMAAGAESLVFDVRSNPGGRVSELCELLDYLLPEGDIFVRTDRDGNEEVNTSDADCVELPMAVLVNADSYSAAEFFAAALREYGWAEIVGEATTGKARSQVTVAFGDGSALHFSKYAYLTPERVDLAEAGGLTPDVETALDEEAQAALTAGRPSPETDPQLAAAIEAVGAEAAPR